MINQQIALKTIKKLGFSVNAVWNGKEALEYLLEKPTPNHPKPDIILMDVQMPILDGYRATHLIRHHQPYSTVVGIRTLPIVAMTASAIQGDKEKCQKAGMDDYLAKPVKGKTLEDMLLKWAVEGKHISRRSIPLQTHSSDHDSNCTDPPPTDVNIEASIPSSENDSRSRAIANSSTLPGTESEGDRGMQRVEAEEKATALRDEKLLAASDSSPYDHFPTTPPNGASPRPNPPTAALTAESLGRLDREHESDSIVLGASGLIRETPSGDIDSLAGDSRDSSQDDRSTIGSLHSPRKAARARGEAMEMTMRGKLARNESDRSQVTVKQLHQMD